MQLEVALSRITFLWQDNGYAHFDCCSFHIRLLSLISSLQHMDLIEKHLQQVSVVSDEAFVAYLRLLSSM